MDNEELETQKEYTERVDIAIDDSIISWDPVMGELHPVEGENAVEIISAINRYIILSSPDTLTITATPEGPVLPATTADLYTVVWAIESQWALDHKITYYGDAPTMADMGLDEESNFDEYGNPIVR
jgi:hypothetical protein